MCGFCVVLIYYSYLLLLVPREACASSFQKHDLHAYLQLVTVQAYINTRKRVYQNKKTNLFNMLDANTWQTEPMAVPFYILSVWSLS